MIGVVARARGIAMCTPSLANRCLRSRDSGAGDRLLLDDLQGPIDGVCRASMPSAGIRDKEENSSRSSGRLHPPMPPRSRITHSPGAMRSILCILPVDGRVVDGTNRRGLDGPRLLLYHALPRYGTQRPISAVLRLILFNVKAPAEALDTACRIQNALLTCIERMALRANVNLEDRLRASNGKRVTTRAGDGGLYVIWVDSRLHDTPAVSCRLRY